MSETPPGGAGRGRRREPGPGRIAAGVARVLVRGRWFVVAGWAAATFLALFVLPPLSHTGGSNDLEGLVPSDTPAVAAELRTVEHFGFPLTARTVLVQRNSDGVSVYDQARTATAAAAVMRREYPRLRRLEGALPISNSGGVFPGARERDTTSLTYLFFAPEVSFGAQSRVAHRYTERFFSDRDDIIGVTGSVPARAAQADLIRENLSRVELLTLLAIVLIVGFAMRSVVAPVVALACAGVAYVMTLRLSGALADALGVAVPNELEPVVVALLLGVVTDYVIFYLAGFRRQLQEGLDPRRAAEAATARYGPIVVAAGLAVAAGTGALLVSRSLFFRALGPALVFTVAVGLVVAVTLVPAIMAILGRWVFWPVPPQRQKAGDRRGLLAPIAAWLVVSRRRAAAVVVACVALLGLATLPLTQLGLGVSFLGSLPPDSGVRLAADQARAGFAPGILSPTTVLVEGEDLDEQRAQLRRLGSRLTDESGVAGVLGPAQLPPRLALDTLITDDGRAARFLVVLDDPALGATGIATVDRLQDDLDELVAESGLDADSVVLAGDTATAAYIVEQTTDDLVRIAVAALIANLVMVAVFLRAIVAAVYLLVGSLLALGAALGLTMLVFGQLDPGAGLTFYVPFAVAVLLLAFGSDYNIYTVGNVWEEARRRPLRDAIATAMPPAARAIIVAGLALGASFGLLGVVPLTSFRQLAFGMGVGILLDVLIVRCLLVPALLTVVGPVSAWPARGRLRGAADEADEADDGPTRLRELTL